MARGFSVSTQLGYSMFQDVLFPAVDQAAAVTDEVLQLRRLKRFVPAPELTIPAAPIVIFDLETTGLDPTADRIIEIGGIKMLGGRMVQEFSALVHTDIELTEEIVKLTGISQDMLIGQ